MSEPTPYVLGSDDPEIARLDGQASSIAGTTDALLRAAGIGGPMRSGPNSASLTEGQRNFATERISKPRLK